MGDSSFFKFLLESGSEERVRFSLSNDALAIRWLKRRIKFPAFCTGLQWMPLCAVMLNAYSGEIDQGSGVMPISVPVDSDQVIGAERRWRGDCVLSDRNRQEEVGEN